MGAGNLIGRQDEYDILFKAFRSGKNIDIYGFHGVGKTYIVEYFFSKIESKYDAIYLNIDEENCKDLVLFIQYLVEKIDSPDLLDKIDVIKNTRKREIIVNVFSSIIPSLKESNSFFVFDNIHVVEKTWDDFADQIFRFKDDNFRLVTMGCRKRKCTFLQKEKQFVPCKLENFTEGNTRELVRILSARHKFDIKNEKLAFETIFRLTIGHPESICIAVTHWTNDYNQPLDGEDIQSRYGEGIAALLEQFIQVKILPPLSSALQEEEHYPSGETPLSLLQHLAPLRLLPLSIIRQVLIVMFPDFYKINSIVDRELFRILYKNIILEENEEKIYEMPEIVRNILIEDLRVNNEKKFRKINEKILSVYNTLIKHNIMRRYEYLTEKIYHIVLPAADVQERENFVRTAISEHVKQYDNTDIKQLQNTLQNDEWLSDKINWKALFKSL